QALQAPHVGDEEPLYPGTCRAKGEPLAETNHSRACHWRFQVPDGEVVVFEDARQGTQSFMAGKDFGDFVVWRNDDVPAYQLAVAGDDAAMQITEVVRSADLL